VLLYVFQLYNMPYTEEFAEIEVRHAFIKKVLHINMYCLGCCNVDVVDDSRFIFKIFVPL